MQAFDQLRHLESFLSEEKQRGKKMSELYEVVQYAGNILPRLYDFLHHFTAPLRGPFSLSFIAV